MTDRLTVDSINSDQLDELYDDLDRYEEVQGDMNEKAIDLTREVARTQAALSDMTRDRDRQQWYANENDRKRKVQRARAEEAEATVARILAALPPYSLPTHGDRSEGVQMGWDLARQAILGAVGQPTPAATEATEPHTGLVVQQYRNDQGEHRWVFRCWGDDHCDGLVSLDHTSQRWAEKARDRHLAEEHKIVPAPGPCPACRRADQAGLADSEQHPQCAGEQQPRAAVAPTRMPEIDRSLAARPGGDEGAVMPGPVIEQW